ncbi:MAG TPA: hypothetical protein VNY05_42590 [Candidatus Acidoferrales bacterium]|nr:hypothetical protein [Candidatus Acidoferrales bacterium]
MGQVVNLRRIGNPPAGPYCNAANTCRLTAASRRRINNPPLSCVPSMFGSLKVASPLPNLMEVKG